MLLSTKKKFIFIHVPKVAGQSVTNALMPFAASNWQRILSYVIPYRYQLKGYTKLRRCTGITFNPQPFVDHIKASEVIESIGTETFNHYFSFAFVRNPWAWALSRYTYAVKNPRHRRHELMRGFESFDTYLRWHCNDDERFYLQKSYVCNSNGEQLVSFVGKQEQLDTDFAHVCHTIGIDATLPVFNVSNQHSYRITMETIQKNSLLIDMLRTSNISTIRSSTSTYPTNELDGSIFWSVFGNSSSKL